jgi:hypothetical protein
MPANIQELPGSLFRGAALWPGEQVRPPGTVIAGPWTRRNPPPARRSTHKEATS